MKKIKISELPLSESLKGLHTIGTDAQNRSVKVSLEFIQTTTEEAVNNANAAAESANTATDNAVKATEAASKAASDASSAASKADTATADAVKAKEAAVAATVAAKDATALTIKATDEAETATEDAIAATEYTEAATVDANKATEEARNATQAILQAFSSLVPSGMTVNAPSRITFGNISPNLRIDADLAPEGTAKNIIYIGDNKAVEVDTEGRLTVIGLGTSKIHVVPTLNTALARTVLIEVGSPTLRKVKTKSLRLLGNGNFRLN